MPAHSQLHLFQESTSRKERIEILLGPIIGGSVELAKKLGRSTPSPAHRPRPTRRAPTGTCESCICYDRLTNTTGLCDYDRTKPVTNEHTCDAYRKG